MHLSDFERVIVDTTVQEKAVAHPVDSRLLEIARSQSIKAAQAVGISFKQMYAKECKQLWRKAGGYRHARQYKRLRKVLKRQRTILSITLRWVQRQLQAIPASAAAHLKERLHTVVARATRVHKQRAKDKNKLYAMHAPEVGCIGKGKARRPYEFRVKTAIAVTHTHGLMVGARTFPGNPYDGHILAAQLEQTNILLEDMGVKPRMAIVDLGFRGKSVEYHKKSFTEANSNT